MKYCYLTILILFVLENLRCQENFKIHKSCAFNHEIVNQKLTLNDCDYETKNALSTILNFTGLPLNFVLKEATINNACAVIFCPNGEECQRYILYDKNFLKNWTINGKPNYTAYAILAHEVGHHLSGHTLVGTSDRHTEELEADKFAGFILQKMGASISELKMTYSILSESSSESHPSKMNRVSALINGWYLARNENLSNTKNFELGTFKDSDNNVYKTVTIGVQTWMADNLRRKTVEGYFIPNNDVKNVKNFGYLYTWDAANESCPSGWHLPSIDEFELLISFLGGDKNVVKKIKSSNYWETINPYEKGDNSSNFNALPAGNYYNGSMYEDSSFVENFGTSTAWWTTNSTSYGRAWIIGIINDESIIAEGKPRKDNGYSVRCVKD